jgi:aldehyde dehydrogenase (NAD+)
VFADVDNAHTIAAEEIFGPVVTITPYADVDDAVRIANDSEYGPAGTVWTTDAERGLAPARRVETETVGINHYTDDIPSPMSGIRASGVAFKLGPEALTIYPRFQSVYL